MSPPRQGSVRGESPELLIDLATRFYVDGQSQVAIARELGLDPSTVSRHLRRAREEGIVRIQIQAPPRHVDELGEELASRFDLQRAVVVASDQDIALAGADFVSTLLRNGMRLGLSWGRMLSRVAERLPQNGVTGLDIALMHGGVGNAGPGIQAHELARHVASLYRRSAVTYLHAPLLVDSLEIKEAMLSDGSINASLQAAASSELALVGIGTLDPDAPLVRYGHLSASDRDRLLASGAVGDVGTHFFTVNGEHVPVLDDRLVAIGWEELRSVPCVIALANGRTKTHAILGALRSKVLDIIVTDADTARSVLDAERP